MLRASFSSFFFSFASLWLLQTDSFQFSLCSSRCDSCDCIYKWSVLTSFNSFSIYLLLNVKLGMSSHTHNNCNKAKNKIIFTTAAAAAEVAAVAEFCFFYFWFSFIANAYKSANFRNCDVFYFTLSLLSAPILCVASVVWSYLCLEQMHTTFDTKRCLFWSHTFDSRSLEHWEKEKGECRRNKRSARILSRNKREVYNTMHTHTRSQMDGKCRLESNRIESKPNCMHTFGNRTVKINKNRNDAK